MDPPSCHLELSPRVVGRRLPISTCYSPTPIQLKLNAEQKGCPKRPLSAPQQKSLTQPAEACLILVAVLTRELLDDFAIFS
jgi:hypothetical protein